MYSVSFGIILQVYRVGLIIGGLVESVCAAEVLGSLTAAAVLQREYQGRSPKKCDPDE